jgi:hypothetical protein
MTLTGSPDHPLLDSFTNAGTVIIAPGMTLRVTGDYTQIMSGTLDVPLGGPPASRQYGWLTVYGTATLAGMLQIDVVNSYGGNPGDEFTILSFGSRVADFDNQSLRAGAAWAVDDQQRTGTVTF